MLSVLLRHVHRENHGRLERAIHRIGVQCFELIDDLLGVVIGDLTEDGVVTVQPRGRHGG